MSKSRKGNNNELIRNKKNVFCGFDYSSSSETETNPNVVELTEKYDEDNKTYLSDIRKYNTPLLSEQNYKYRGEIDHRERSNSDHDSSPRVPYSEIEFQYGGTDTSLNNYDSDNEIQAKEKNVLPNLNLNMEVQKSICVQNQLTLWEKLLEARISSQKILNKANNLPCPKDFKRYSLHKEYAVSAKETKQNLEVLLEKLVETKAALGMQFSEINKLELSRPVKNTQKTTDKFEVLIKSNFEKFKPYRNSILLKWEDRTKLLTSYKTGKTRGPLEKLSIVRNINNHLTGLNELIIRSRTIKSHNHLPKKQDTDMENKCIEQTISDVEVYDDTDFYHSQLRELIEYKTNTSTNSYDSYELNTQFSELQKLRQKMKRKVDTRASKGRKIRYMVHKKLVNFMGSKCSSMWTEESKSELFKSLFLT